MARLFIAAWPNAATKGALRHLPRPDEPGVRWVPEANLHITLRFVGDADFDELTALLAGYPLPRVEAELGPRITHLGPQRLVIPATGIDELAAAVRDATADVGQRERRRFRGHLTVARTRRNARSSAYGTPFEGGWTVHEVALVSSELNHTGAVYTTVATVATS